MIDFSFKRYICSTGHKDSWYLQSEFSEDAWGEARTRNPSGLKPKCLAFVEHMYFSDEKSITDEI